MYRYLRYPRTAQEKRANQEGWERPSRNVKNLVDVWDELWRKPQRSWKRHRRTQYKQK